MRLMLDRPGRELTLECQRIMEEVSARRAEMAESRWWALSAVQMAKVQGRMARHRQRNLDRILMQGLGPRSKQARLMDKQRRLRMSGALQPARESIFEPFIFVASLGNGSKTMSDKPFGNVLSPYWQGLRALRAKALARLDVQPPRYGARRSPVMEQVVKARKELVRRLPDPPPPLPHIAARRGRRAVVARRLAKKARHGRGRLEPEEEELEEGSQQLIVQQDGAELDDDEFEHWMKRTSGASEEWRAREQSRMRFEVAPIRVH